MRLRHLRLSKTTWNGLILFLLLMQVFIIQWLDITNYYSIALDIILILFMVANKKRFYKMRISIIPLIIYAFYFFIQITRQDAQIGVIISNFIPVTTSLLIVFSICLLWADESSLINNLKSFFPLINFYMMINVPVLILQMNGNSELSGRHPIGITASLKEDLISGLFGYYGTPMLATFASFFFIYDLWYMRYFVKKPYKKYFLIYYFLLFAFYLYISIPSANSGYYLVLAMFIAFYMLISNNGYKRIQNRIKSNVKMTLVFLSSTALLIMGYRYIDIVTTVIDRYFRIYTSGKSSNLYFNGGSYVRFGMIDYFFNSDVNKLFGVGIGAIKWKQNYSFGFKNFGQSDLGAFLLIGGLVLVSILLLVFIYCINKRFRSLFLSVLGTALLVFLTIYTQPFTTTSIIISFMLFMLVCGLEVI